MQGTTTRLPVAFVLIGLVYGQSQNITYEDCGSNAQLLSVVMEPCDSDPCVLKRKHTAAIRYSLISDQDSDSATIDARMKLFGINVRVPGIERNLCKGAVECPVFKGKTYNGTMEVYVPWYIPNMTRDVDVKIIGDKGLSVCLRMKVMIR
ncbi:hypothetical protein MTO96_001003 [Rhipicephalus appendiculatus]